MESNSLLGEKEFTNHTVVVVLQVQRNNELVLTVVGIRFQKKLETIRQNKAESVQLKVNQVHNWQKLDSETTKEFYESDKVYQKLSEKDSQNDLTVKKMKETRTEDDQLI